MSWGGGELVRDKCSLDWLRTCDHSWEFQTLTRWRSSRTVKVSALSDFGWMIIQVFGIEAEEGADQRSQRGLSFGQGMH